ncbi:MAG TPA: Ig-like domain-containing protein, partial [Gemmataceae bacterium]|nr:Ig-like domain-containing protein [Gemmataceae bacterium]
GKVETLALTILASAEYFQLSGNTNDGFLADLYEDLLLRPIDPLGRAGWNQVLASGVSRLTVATLIFNGTENLNIQVNLQYEKLLRREADTGGLSSFAQVERQSGIDAVIAGLAGSDEYFALAQGTPVQLPGTTPTSTTLVPSLATVGLNQAETFTARVSPTSVGPFTASGTVVFTDGNTTLATVPLSSGRASFTTTMLTTGQHTVSAAYSGDANFAASTASASVSVNPVSTSVTLTSSAGTTSLGQMVTFTAAVSPSTAGTFTASGTIAFQDGNVTLAAVPLSGGMAMFTTAGLAAGSHTINAVYSGDASFTIATGTATQIVNPLATTTMLISSASSANPNQSVTFTASVQPHTGGPFNAAGSATFTDGSSVLGTANVSNGVAAFTTSTLSPGTHTITATYNGDGNFLSSSDSVPQTINLTSRVATTTQVTAAPNPSNLNEAVTFTATVTPPSFGGLTLSGTVSFMDGATPLGTVGLNGNTATFMTAALMPGGHMIVADYNGDANFNPSSGFLIQTVNTVTTSVTLASSVNPVVYGQLPTFTATVSVSMMNAGTPTGMVEFLDGNTGLGTGTLQTINGQNVASFTPPMAPSVGQHSITAVYLGDATFGASSPSPALIETVNQASTSTAVLSSLNPSHFGDSVSFTATVSVTAPGAGTPSGSVVFQDTFGGATTTLGGGAVTLQLINGQFQATLANVTTLASGSHQIRAVYSGDNNFASSTSAALTQTVNQKTNTTTTLQTSANPVDPSTVNGMGVVTFLRTVTFTATVTAGATGQVVFMDGMSQIGTVTLGSNSKALLTLTTKDQNQSSGAGILKSGRHTITAQYLGDSNFAPSPVSSSLSQDVRLLDEDGDDNVGANGMFEDVSFDLVARGPNGGPENHVSGFPENSSGLF